MENDGYEEEQIQRRANHRVHQLQANGVTVTDEKPSNASTLLIGLGIFAALIASSA